MMTFVYRCTECGAIMEIQKGMQDPHPTTIAHEGCNGPVQHVFLSCGIVFKGKGFYKSDTEMRQMDKSLKAAGDEGLDVYDERFGVPK